MGDIIWIGAYSKEDNVYEIDTIESVCKFNESVYNASRTGLAPVCAAFTPEAAGEQLEEIRKVRKGKYYGFETAVTEQLEGSLKEPVTVYIEPGTAAGNGDDYVHDKLVIAPSKERNDVRIEASVDHYYRLYSDYRVEDDAQDAIEKAVHDIIEDISELVSIAGF